MRLIVVALLLLGLNDLVAPMRYCALCTGKKPIYPTLLIIGEMGHTCAQT